MSGELHAAGYNPNEGSNCGWLPYSYEQFLRARAYGKALQKHRGGHTDSYFQTVAQHIETVAEMLTQKFCPAEGPDKDTVVRYMKFQERRIWLGIASAKKSEFH